MRIGKGSSSTVSNILIQTLKESQKEKKERERGEKLTWKKNSLKLSWPGEGNTETPKQDEPKEVHTKTNNN